MVWDRNTSSELSWITCYIKLVLKSFHCEKTPTLWYRPQKSKIYIKIKRPLIWVLLEPMSYMSLGRLPLWSICKLWRDSFGTPFKSNLCLTCSNYCVVINRGNAVLINQMLEKLVFLSPVYWFADKQLGSNTAVMHTQTSDFLPNRSWKRAHIFQHIWDFCLSREWCSSWEQNHGETVQRSAKWNFCHLYLCYFQQSWHFQWPRCELFICLLKYIKLIVMMNASGKLKRIWFFIILCQKDKLSLVITLAHFSPC